MESSEDKKSILPELKMNRWIKNKKIIVIITLALISTFIQFIIINILSKKSENKKYAAIVAKKILQKNDLINEENTKLTYLELGVNKDKFILNSEFRKYIGRKITVNIDENTPILKEFITGNAQEISLPEKIPPGKRFYVMNVDLSSLSSLIKVGDKVDIIAHMDINGFGKVTETILNRVKIIGIGNEFEEQSSNPDANTLSFYLTPEEVKIISFMKSYSQFTVALRNPNDPELVDNNPITFNKFIQNEKIQKIFQNDPFKIIEGKTVKRKDNVENH